jgi:hypothetical protein
MEPGPVDQVLDLSLCAFAFSGYVLFSFVQLEPLSQSVNIEEEEKEVTMSIVINYERPCFFHVALECVSENIS